MILKRIELKGFKSFADRTVIDFDDAISCIVGPNGSGKSNITDAFRWVLGEQRYKTLRGSQMLDVIFSGTKTRQPLGFAEVVIVFDNKYQVLPIDFNEVRVSRRLHRSGESEYTINGTECRLKDIKQLFMDTGIGVEGYSIIGQGRIDSILSTNKDERRLIFEEAAGIVKYRTRKSEAERKLERTEGNLNRIKDIVGELKERLSPLEKDAEKAIIHKKISAEIKDLEINLFIKDIEAAEKNIDIIAADLNACKTRRDEFEEQKNQLVNQLNRYSFERENAEKEYDNQLQKQGELKMQIAQIEGELRLLKEKQLAKQTSLNNLVLDADSKAEDLANLKDEIKDLDLVIKTKKEEEQALKLEVENLQQQIINLKTDKHSTQQQEQALQAQLLSYNNELQELHHSKQRINLQAELAAQKLLEIKKNLELLQQNKKDKQANLVQAKQKLSIDNAEIERLENLRKERLEKQNSLNDKQLALEKTLFDKQSQLSQKSASLDALELQEQNNEGFSYAVKKVLEWSKEDSEIYGCFKDLLTIDAKFFTAIEIALGRNLQMLIVKDSKVVNKYIDKLKREKAGRATFLPIADLKVKAVPELETSKGFYGCAFHYVECSQELEPAFNYLLNRIYFADTLDDAKKAAKNLPLGSRVVSLDGQIVNAGGTITGGSISKKESGFLKRKQEIKDLKVLTEKLNLEIDELNREREKKQEELKKLREEIELAEIDDTRVKNSLNESKHVVKSLELELDTIETKLKTLESEQESLDLDINSADNKANAFQEQIESLKANQVLTNEAIAKYSSELAEYNDAIDSINQKITEQRIEQSRITEHILAQEQKLFERKERISSYDLKRKQAELVKETLTTEIEHLIFQQREIESKLEANKERLAVLGKELNDEKLALEKGKTEQQEYQTQLAKARESLQSEQQSIYKLDISLARIETKLSTLTESLLENYQLTYQQALQFRHEVEDKNYQSKLRSLKSELKKLGDVNLSAIEEYETVKERYQFLAEQEDDLQTAIDSLEKMIRQIDREMRKSFKTKLVEVNNYFKDTFTKLFGGGTGDIAIEADGDILSGEIIISAQPPGKKLQSLDLLSGGEKALTAIALLFAILKTKPSPFCILDEIEAALDDVNIFRFAEFLQEFIADSQFIIITHRKGTMEIAQSIYGVTMQEKGISKVLSVKLQDAKELVE